MGETTAAVRFRAESTTEKRDLNVQVSEDLDAMLKPFEDRAVITFRTLQDLLVDMLEDEGVQLRFALTSGQAKDVADYVFGVRFSREMKGLLRDSVRVGIEAAGHSLDPDERYVNRVWQENRVFVDRIRDDLKFALRRGEFEDLADISKWFETNAYREEMMGRYLAKQGIEGGFAYARDVENPGTKMLWELGPVTSQHCGTCQERAGMEFSYEELMSIGTPGSTHLNCAAACKCTLVEVGR